MNLSGDNSSTELGGWTNPSEDDFVTWDDYIFPTEKINSCSRDEDMSKIWKSKIYVLENHQAVFSLTAFPHAGCTASRYLSQFGLNMSEPFQA